MLTKDTKDCGNCRLLSFRRHQDVNEDDNNEKIKNKNDTIKTQHQSRSRTIKNKKYNYKIRSTSIGSTLDIKNSKFIKYVPTSLRRVLSTSFINFDKQDSTNNHEFINIFNHYENDNFDGIVPLSYQIFHEDNYHHSDDDFKLINNINSSEFNNDNRNCILFGLKNINTNDKFMINNDNNKLNKLTKKNDEKLTRRDLQRANILRRRKYTQRSFSVPVSFIEN